LNTAGVSGGTIPLNKIAVTSDGIIYADNVAVSTAENFKIYRKSSYSAAPTVAYSGLPDGGVTARWGDSFALRGTGNNTQIIVSGSGATTAVIFTTTDGTNFSPTVITPSPALGGGALSKGLWFGNSGSFYAKNNSTTIATNFLYDVNSGSAT